MMRSVLLLTLCSATALVSGCYSSTSDLQQWVNDQERAAANRPYNAIQVARPVTFEPYIYQALSLKSPFDPSRLLGDVITNVNTELPDWIRQELYERTREDLESIPLDSMVMVGSMQQRGRTVALIRVEELLYQVKVGDYLGQNFGKIERITETTIEIRELVPSTTDNNEWVMRPVTMQLQEAQS